MLEENQISSDKRARVNEQIRETEVRLVDAEGQQIGIVSIAEAMAKAKEAALDLVEVSPNVSPPVCRIMNYGKFMFGRKKVTKHQRQVQIKELKFRPVTEEGDFQVKLRNAKRFLANGDKVKITMRFRGREVLHQEIGVKLINRLKTELEQIGILEQEPKLEGRQTVMVIAPKQTTKGGG